MTDIPASGYLENAARTVAEMKAAFEDLRDFVEEDIGGDALSELTISTGAVTPTKGQHTIDTEADAASDDLDNILQTNLPDGKLLLIRAADGARTVVVKNNSGGAGQIYTADGNDFSLDETEKFLLLIRNGTAWYEVARSIYSASATLAGLVELATGAETVTGTDATRAVTPDGLTDKIKDEDDMVSDSADHLATQQSIKKYVDDNAGSGGVEKWTEISNINSTAPSTSTFKVTDQTEFEALAKGMAVKFTLGAGASNPGTYYAVITSLSAWGGSDGTVTIAGAPLETGAGDLSAAYYSALPGMVQTLTFVINGSFADAADTALLENDLLMGYKWDQAKAYCVKISHIVATDDSGANQPRVNARLGSTAADYVSTSNTNAGKDVAETWTDTIVDISITKYDLDYGDTVEIKVDGNGSNGDAKDLTVILTFVFE